jgi:hypothetical protein
MNCENITITDASADDVRDILDLTSHDSLLEIQRS